MQLENSETIMLLCSFKTLVEKGRHFVEAFDRSEIRFVVILLCYIVFYGFFLALEERGWQPVILAPMMTKYSLHIGSAIDCYLFQLPLYIEDSCLQFLPNREVGEWNMIKHSFCVTSACSATMQLWLFWCWVLFGKGTWQRKLLYLPFSGCVILLANGIRIGLLGWIIVCVEPCFNLFHDEILSCLIPLVMFGLWVQMQRFFNVKPHGLS